MSYWSGVRRRALPALAVGVVAVVAMVLFGDDWLPAALSGCVMTLAAALLPARSAARDTTSPAAP